MMDYGRRLLRLRDEAALAIGEMRGLNRGTLSLGANETTCLYLLPHVLASFKRQYPQVQVDIQRAISRNIIEKIVEGTLDFGIVTLPVHDARLVSLNIHDDDMALIVGPDHPLASRRSVRMQELADEPFILHKVGTTTRERLVKHFGDGGVKIKVTMELASIETIKRFVSIGMGISIVPRLCIDKEMEDGSLAALRVQGAKFQRQLGLVYHKDRYQSHAARAFLGLFEGKSEPSMKSRSKSPG